MREFILHLNLNETISSKLFVPGEKSEIWWKIRIFVNNNNYTFIKGTVDVISNNSPYKSWMFDLHQCRGKSDKEFT